MRLDLSHWLSPGRVTLCNCEIDVESDVLMSHLPNEQKDTIRMTLGHPERYFFHLLFCYLYVVIEWTF